MGRRRLPYCGLRGRGTNPVGANSTGSATLGILLGIVALGKLEVPVLRNLLGGRGILLHDEAALRRRRTALFPVELQAIAVWRVLPETTGADGIVAANLSDFGPMYGTGWQVIWSFVA